MNFREEKECGKSVRVEYIFSHFHISLAHLKVKFSSYSFLFSASRFYAISFARLVDVSRNEAKRQRRNLP